MAQSVFAHSLGLGVEFSVPDDLFETEKFDAALVAAMGDIAREAKSFWDTEAGSKLRSSRKAYKDAIKVDIQPARASIYLDGGFLPSAVERGTAKYDLKPGFLRGHISRNIPLNIRPRAVVFSSPKVFRQVTAASQGWTHPGFPGVKILDKVIRKLEDEIIPMHIDRALDVL